MSEQKINQLREFLEDDPADSFSRFALALEYLKLKRHEEALELFTYIATHDPEYTGVYYHLGKLHAEFGNTEKAMTVWLKGIEVANRQQDLHTSKEITQLMNDMREHDF